MKAELGNIRKFTFSNKDFVVKEILEPVTFEMEWTWDTGICPHCKNRLDKTVNHKFHRIEILSDKEKNDNEITINDVVILGFTLDKRLMLIEKNKYNEVFTLSTKFKYLTGG